MFEGGGFARYGGLQTQRPGLAPALAHTPSMPYTRALAADHGTRRHGMHPCSCTMSHHRASTLLLDAHRWADISLAAQVAWPPWNPATCEVPTQIMQTMARCCVKPSGPGTDSHSITTSSACCVPGPMRLARCILYRAASMLRESETYCRLPSTLKQA